MKQSFAIQEITLSSGRKFKIASLSVAQTRELFFYADGKIKDAEQQMESAALAIAASLNNAIRAALPWYRRIFVRKYTKQILENTLSLAEFREIQSPVLEISGLASAKQGEVQATR